MHRGVAARTGSWSDCVSDGSRGRTQCETAADEQEDDSIIVKATAVCMDPLGNVLVKDCRGVKAFSGRDGRFLCLLARGAFGDEFSHAVSSSVAVCPHSGRVAFSLPDQHSVHVI